MALPPEIAQAVQQWLEQWSRCGLTHVPSVPLTFLSPGGSQPPPNRPSAAVSAPAALPAGSKILPAGPKIMPASSKIPAAELNTATHQPTPPQHPPPPAPSVPLQPIVPVVAAPVVPSSEVLASPLPSSWHTVSRSLEERESAFTTLRSQVAACENCSELACSRTQTVFGVGHLTPKIAFFGEAPGMDEDRVGIPFVGKAGQLLDKIIAASKLKREEVYILNALRCRPPNNRTPSDLEIEKCRPFFEQQLEVLQPQYIVCLGAVAVRAVLQSTEPVGRLRGRFHRYRGAKVLVTYHPAYLLRNESAKKYTWEDMQMLMREIGLL